RVDRSLEAQRLQALPLDRIVYGAADPRPEGHLRLVAERGTVGGDHPALDGGALAEIQSPGVDGPARVDPDAPEIPRHDPGRLEAEVQRSRGHLAPPGFLLHGADRLRDRRC